MVRQYTNSPFAQFLRLARILILKINVRRNDSKMKRNAEV